MSYLLARASQERVSGEHEATSPTDVRNSLPSDKLGSLPAAYNGTERTSGISRIHPAPNKQDRVGHGSIQEIRVEFEDCKFYGGVGRGNV